MHKMRSNETEHFYTVENVNAERRSAQRVQTVFRVARVKTEGDEGLARVRNISDHGLSLQLQIPVLLGDTLAVELADGFMISGEVVWTNGLNCGLKLDHEVDSAALLSELAQQARAPTARALRLPVMTTALSRGENGTRVVELADVSQRGMKLLHDGSFKEGLQVKITLSSGKERRAIVRWSQGNLAGLMLLEPFSTEELGSISQL